jgi:hypothetical protein
MHGIADGFCCHLEASHSTSSLARRGSPAKETDNQTPLHRDVNAARFAPFLRALEKTLFAKVIEHLSAQEVADSTSGVLPA